MEGITGQEQNKLPKLELKLPQATALPIKNREGGGATSLFEPILAVARMETRRLFWC